MPLTTQQMLTAFLFYKQLPTFIFFFLFLEKKKETKKIQGKRDAPPLCRATPPRM